MLLLSADTSGKHGSISLARAAGQSSENNQVEVIEVVPLTGNAFSAQLIPQVAAVLTKHGLTKSDIDGFVVASGPGSFTGLRVGLAAIKALAEVLAKPIAAVSLLEALSVASGLQGRVIAALDAGRGEVYAGEYEVDGAAATLVAEQLLTQAEVFVKARGSTVGSPAFVTSDKILAEAAESAGVPVSLAPLVDAGTIAPLGWRKIKDGTIVSPEALEANYIRRTDAEILAKNSTG